VYGAQLHLTKFEKFFKMMFGYCMGRNEITAKQVPNNVLFLQATVQ
jgi:hypothetical protein